MQMQIGRAKARESLPHPFDIGRVSEHAYNKCELFGTPSARPEQLLRAGLSHEPLLLPKQTQSAVYMEAGWELLQAL